MFWELLLENKIEIQDHPLTLRETKLGWIVCGRAKSNPSFTRLCHLSSLEEIDEHIRSFWKLEDISSSTAIHTGEDLACEIHYSQTVSRSPDGRYTVQLPLRQDPSILGDSKHTAVRRFLRLEAKLVKQPQLYATYKEFMNEYQRLGHMKESTSNSNIEYFIPHHCTQKESSTTTKLRVVFDASAKTSTGLSLNDIMMVGPCIQDSLFAILFRFRMYNYIMTGDLEKMYRQFSVDRSQTNLQKIIWREDPSMPLKIYELLTVTYGTAAASYLATRTLKQLYLDEGSEFPHAAPTLEDFYMDDLITGFNFVDEGLQKQRELISLLKRGQLHIRKWCSTHPDLLKDISEEDKEPLQTYKFHDQTMSAIKTLGLLFDPKHDAFHFSVKNSVVSTLTKRSIVSDIALIFDPLGVIGPVIVTAKMFMQELWRGGLDWDEPVPTDFQDKWVRFRQTFPSLEKIVIPRQVTINPTNSVIEIHAFSDASERAYGTCIYIRCVDRYSGTPLGVHLLCSKSRVAPLKSTSLPRLELVAALLMAQIVDVVCQALKSDKNHVFYWTDSTVVLSWIRSPCTNWVTFVANRVAKIQELSDIDNWHHISGSTNPADVISRGLQANQLLSSKLWWYGPQMLMEREGLANSWQFPEHIFPAEIPEERSQKTTVLLAQKSGIFDILHKFSSINKLIRVMAYVRRFVNNSKIKKLHSHTRQCGQLSVTELNDSMQVILRLTQQEIYPEEIRTLKKQRPLPKTSKLSNLNPYLCSKQLLRVGGRIRHADIPPDQKNPVILPPQHHITRLIARNKHEELLHCGAQSLLTALRLQYWPINGRHLTRSTVHQCIRCFRLKPSYASQLMGDLPSPRVNPSRPFTHTGLDYLGPIMVKLNSSRKAPTTKAHAALFICLATKAIHLELVENQTSESFFSALRRFISRRGKPQIIYSDNASTFKGASNLLLQWQDLITTFTNNCGIQWKFTPPYSPHMGGLWESNVKRVKYHIRRTMGPHILTYVNLYTLLTEIEAIINSRPLFPLSNDPYDYSYLSPAHFLIGGPMIVPPQPDLQHININRLNQWQLVQRLLQTFWCTWKNEYLSELQHRTKWKVNQPNITIGTLALIHDDKTVPMNWSLGRVVELHTGTDNRVRVVSLRTSSGIIQRSMARICPLPLDDVDLSQEPDPQHQAST